MAKGFESVIGQKGACETLAHNIERGKIASSYLFAGPQGTGKSTTAEIFAKALLCAGDEKPCGRCKSCAMYASGSHPDIFTVSPDGAMIKIEQIRELISALSLKSYLGGRKAAVIARAEAMNRATANAFLKTLEEPPSDTVIILISSNPSALLRTVVSRCRTIPFVPMEPSKLAVILEEKLGLPAEEALRWAVLAEGCYGRAAGGMEDIKAIDDEARELMARIRNMPPEEVFDFTRGWKDRRADLPLLLERMAETLRYGQTGGLKTQSDIMRGIMDASGDEPRVMDCFDMLIETGPALKFNPNVQLFLEALIFNMQSVLNKGHRIGT